MGKLNKILAFIELSRPLEWTKTIGNMILGIGFAAFLYGAKLPLLKVFLGFVSASLLWSGLYGMNDFVDWEKDKRHPVKRERPIPSGRLTPKEAFLFSLLSVVLGLVLGFFVDKIFFLMLFFMVLNQTLYTFYPIRLKERPILDLISGSSINPILRFLAGWFLVVKEMPPVLPLLFVVFMQFGGYTLYRLSGKKVEKKLKYKSSFVLFKKKTLQFVATFSIMLGVVVYFLLCFLPYIGIKNKVLGFLSFRFLIFGFINLIPFKYYLPAIKNPEKADIKKLYRVIYFHLMFFIVGFVFLLFM